MYFSSCLVPLVLRKRQTFGIYNLFLDKTNLNSSELLVNQNYGHYIFLCYFSAYYKCYVHFLLSQKKIGDFVLNLWYVNTIPVLARQVACTCFLL